MRHHVVEWREGQRPVFFLHGFLDHARLFDRLVGALDPLVEGQSPSLSLLGVDFRGHGDSDHASPGSAYHLSDYIADVYGLLDALAPERQAVFVAHGMGGTVALQLAGAFPERVSHLVLLEGLGRRPALPSVVVDRTRAFVMDNRRIRDRPYRFYPTLEAAAQKVVARNPSIRLDDALHYARYGTRVVDEQLTWKFDPRLHARRPLPWLDELLLPFMARCTARVLVIDGSQGQRLDAEPRQQRIAALRAERRVIEGAGHHLHLDAPEEIAREIARFIRE